jgi:PKD repeat protein
VVLIHGGLAGGAEAYRNAAGQIVYYDPDTAVPVGYVLPPELDPEYTTVALRPGLNGAGAIANGGLLNLSVAASSWILRIPASSRGTLDYSQIEDIEIMMDSTGRALSGLLAAAQADSELLVAGLELAPTEIEPVYGLPLSMQSEPMQALDLAPSLPGRVGGSYFGSVMVTSPLTIAIQVLNLDLWNDGGTLSGNVNAAEASLYPDDVGLTGTAAGDGAFSLTSEPFTITVAGRAVTQAFTLTGHMEEDGDILRAVYTAMVTNLLPDPILVQGSYSGSRPGAVGSQRLVVRTGTSSLPSGATTTITATLFYETMRVMTDTTTTVSFTTDWGAVIPAEVDTVEGVATVTFTAPITPGQVTIWATTGELTGTARIQVGVSGLAQPVANFSATPLNGTAPLAVTFIDLTSGSPENWLWNFGDGGSSIEQHPDYTYLESGVYTATLTVSNALGIDTLTRTNYITVSESAAGVQFTAGPVFGPPPLRVTFMDQSTGSPTEWLWDFGDGSSSTIQHPVYTYTALGSYTVTLVCTGTAGAATLTRPNYISVTEQSPIYLPLIFKDSQ